MSSLLVLLEDCIKLEFGPGELAAVRAVAAERRDTSTTLQKTAALLSAVAEVRRKRESEVYRWFGKLLVEPMLREFPQLIKGYSSTRSLLLQCHQLATSAMTVFLPGTPCPELWADLLDQDSLRIGFDGPEEIAQLIEGVVQGFGVHYSELVEVSRATPPPQLAERRLIDVRVLPDRRHGPGAPPAAPVGERRSGVVSGITTFLR